jgi:hypothetical protein
MDREVTRRNVRSARLAVAATSDARPYSSDERCPAISLRSPSDTRIVASGRNRIELAGLDAALEVEAGAPVLVHE